MREVGVQKWTHSMLPIQVVAQDHPRKVKKLKRKSVVKIQKHILRNVYSGAYPFLPPLLQVFYFATFFSNKFKVNASPIFCFFVFSEGEM